MMCDLIIASDTAKFGQPEIKLGIMPGIGGTQRLARAVGKSKAMEMCLTGRLMDAAEAERAGLVARVVPAADLIAEALRLRAGLSAPCRSPRCWPQRMLSTRPSRRGLAEGIRHERAGFYALFATHDQKEGMAAFIEKRPPSFRNC